MSKVNIIYNPNKQDVLGRLARALHQGTGWTISRTPNDNVDINYYMLYISYAQAPYLKTKVGAWFSHKDIDIPKKVEWWDIAASGVDIITTTAPEYYEMLSKIHDNVHTVMPPVDNQFFSTSPFRIGIAGYVHPAGRKGESLAFKLHDELPLNWRLQATGRGWGKIPHKEYKWDEMHRFYEGIDVFLCTSLIEGVPMPPLEALAANKPIVIPYSVGMLDEITLDYDYGVFRYDVGDYDSMLRALEDAYSYINVRQEYAKRYSIERWADDHKRAFGIYDKPIEVTWSIIASSDDSNVIAKPMTITVKEDNLLLPTDYPDVLAPKEGRKPIADACVVYIAYGNNAREMAQIAINSWHENMTESIVFISDETLDNLSDNDVFIYHEDSDIGARSIKTRLHRLVPDNFKSILYLDADTEVLGDVSFLFSLLSRGFDFAIAMNPPKYYSVWEHKRPDNVLETDITIDLVGAKETLLFNGGVFALKRSKKTMQFMDTWHDEWQRWGARDQMSLLRALYEVPLKVQYLTQSWNTIVRYVDPMITSGILHHPQSARRWVGKIDGRLDSELAWQKVREYERNSTG